MSHDGKEEPTGTPKVSVVTADDFDRRGMDLKVERAQRSDAPQPEPGIDELPEYGREQDLPEAPQVARDEAQVTARPAKADIRRRAFGRAIDIVIFGLLAESIAYVGPLVALVYLLLSDCIIDGASIGKKLAKLRVVRNSDGRSAGIFDSLLRNAPLGIAGLFVLIPLVGWALFLTLGLAVILFESYMVWRDPRGVRAGDILAGTTVVETASPPVADLTPEN